ncbi:unnamed protein product [Mytilus coruscus]|uniref:Uncharacterized protein n=1 Tax=Mytilus coruscus TaxID=42192 RepID=A0A6J8ERD2_MYTCO|nr:unnamed protein product [Mytilus coruscus]
MPKTPPSSIKISTADQIENSVEKLRNLNLCEKETGARVAKKSRQQLNFSTELEHAYSQQNVIKMQHEEEDQVLLNDHEYSIPNKALETSEKVAEDFIKEAVSHSVPARISKGQGANPEKGHLTRSFCSYSHTSYTWERPFLSLLCLMVIQQQLCSVNAQ